MAQQTINIGASPNDGTGTPLRTAFQYTNSNFSELYTAVGPSGNNIVVPGNATITGDLTVDTNVLKVNTTTNRVGINTTTPTQNLEITGSGNPLAADGCSAVRLNNTVSGRPAVVGVDDSQNFVIWNVGTEVSETIKFLTGGGNGKEQYRITHGGLFNWYDGAGGTRMTLNSTGLGVGTASHSTRLGVVDTVNTFAATFRGNLGTDFVAIGTTALGASINGYTAGFGAASNLVLQPNGGNVGIGVAPSAWESTFKAIQINNRGAYISATSNSFSTAPFVQIGNNGYYDATNSRWEYVTANAAAQYVQASNSHLWYTAAVGSADAEITDFATAKMTLDASGRLILLASTTTPATLATNGQLTFTATSNTNLRFSYRGSDGVTRTADLTLA